MGRRSGSRGGPAVPPSAVESPLAVYTGGRHPWARVQDGDLHIMFSIGRPKEGSVQIQFFIDQWIYNNPLPFSFANRNLTLWTEDSKETGEALAETFRPWLEEE